MNESILYTEIYVQKRWEFKQILCQVVGIERYYIMRGQANANWDISSRLERKTCRECMKEIEDFMIIKCRNHPKFKSSSRYETIAKLQHYGGYTNFVDFTHSLDNALYFSVHDPKMSHENEDFAVWLVLTGDLSDDPKVHILPLWRIDKECIEGDYQLELDQKQYRDYLLFDNELPFSFIKEKLEEYAENYPEILKEFQIAGLDILSEQEYEYERKRLEEEGIRFKRVREFKEEEHKKLEWLKHNYPFIYRMVIQKGLFLYSTNIKHSFMENLFLTSNLDDIQPEIVEPSHISGATGNGFSKMRRVIKITFNYKLREFIRKYLEKENITEEMLFPVQENVSELEEYASRLLDDYLHEQSKK